MKSSVNQPYSITRIRLINFHNLLDETIPIANGGHLFLLGDNGSGKTTILDAVHYVLSAGESMEFNAAARVTGRQAEGRRLQGVITRYNVDTGPLNKSGGITYAALEIKGRQGRPMTIGIGMSVAAQDENVQRWGIIRECPLEELQFIHTDDGGRRPRTREEMKLALGESSGFFNIGAYRAEIANRLFGGEELFKEVCEFLKMGKAYREIAARAGDYNELFRSLLPEPKPELFDRIIRALKDLDGSRSILENLERKTVYLGNLEKLVKDIDEARDEKLRYAWLVQHLELDRLTAARGVAEAESVRLCGELAALAQAETDRKRVLDDLRQRLADLQAKDALGLVRQEKDCAADWERTKMLLGKRQDSLTAAEKWYREAQKQWSMGRELLAENLRKTSGDLGAIASEMPFPITELLAALDTAHRSAPTVDPIAIMRGLPVSAVLAQGETELSQVRTQAAQAEARLGEARQRADSAKEAIAALEKQVEAMPDLPGFSNALARLGGAMLDASPLYRGLEWKPGLAQDTMAAVEEMIGDAVLGTLLVPERDWDAARDLIYGEFPLLRVARQSQPENVGKAETIPGWIQENFDIGKSDPCAIECLAREMASRVEPHDGKWKQWHVGQFRAHERRLLLKAPRLVGSEYRRKEKERQLKLRRQELGERQKETRAAELELDTQKKTSARLEKFLATLRQHHERLTQFANDAARHGLDLQYADTDRVRQRTEANNAADEEKRLRQRLDELRSLIARENLDKLEQKIQKVQRQIKDTEREQDAAANRRGHLEAQLEGTKAKIVAIQKEAATAEAQRDQAQATLALRHPEQSPDNLPDYVLRIRKGQQFKTLESVRKAEAEANRNETDTMARLDERMKDPVLGATYGFYYERPENRLRDRRGQLLGDVSVQLQQQLAGQREVINEHTHELFQKIIMAELVDFLKRHVIRLEDMTKKVNYVLAERAFGGKRYRLHLAPSPSHKRILEIVRSFNHFETTVTEEKMKEFFADHKDEILNADVNHIPPVLDYRNWYQYEMRMESVGAEDVVMDRRTKSIGSGGEQAVPNYLLILTIAHFLYQGTEIKLYTLLFDEAFYGIDASRRDQILGFATDLGLQLLITSPDQDGVKREIRHSTTVLIVKDEKYNVHLYPFFYENKELARQLDLLEPEKDVAAPAEFAAELTPDAKLEP